MRWSVRGRQYFNISSKGSHTSDFISLTVMLLHIHRQSWFVFLLLWNYDCFATLQTVYFSFPLFFSFSFYLTVYDLSFDLGRLLYCVRLFMSVCAESWGDAFHNNCGKDNDWWPFTKFVVFLWEKTNIIKSRVRRWLAMMIEVSDASLLI